MYSLEEKILAFSHPEEKISVAQVSNFVTYEIEKFSSSWIELLCNSPPLEYIHLFMVLMQSDPLLALGDSSCLKILK